ncbi:MAG: hypothetical protein OSB38_37145, partial [Paraburkholderia fungorum]|nr:hypothetical protein [Paraburkholderia fungorum]
LSTPQRLGICQMLLPGEFLWLATQHYIGRHLIKKAARLKVTPKWYQTGIALRACLSPDRGPMGLPDTPHISNTGKYRSL